jgi:hydrogenase/urease accessory protein HupE
MKLPINLATAILAIAGLASAHTLKVTGVVVHMEESVTTVTVMVHLPMLGGADPATAISQRLHMRLDGAPFHPVGASIVRDPVNDTVTWSAREDRRARSVVVESPVFPDQPDDTTVVLVYRGGQLVDRAALNPAHRSATVAESLVTVVARFVQMGILHILSGPDHILFLFGLILAGGSARQLFSVVTAFTLAHSLTLSLTALGVASLSPRLVEAIIAFSIIVVGLENLLQRRSGLDLRILLAFGFGFFHGFGFAGALADVGLPKQAIGWSLASFNVGVEIGQACIILAALPILAAVRRRSEEAGQLLIRFASVAIAAAGAIWFVARVSA